MVYNQIDMFRKRKRKNKAINEAQPGHPRPTQVTGSDSAPQPAAGVYQKDKTPPALTDEFKSSMEKAADRSRSELISEGKMKPMVFFIYADGTMKTVTVSVKDEHQKEALIQRIREKASAENITTVIALTEMESEGRVIFSGVCGGVRGSARVEYSFDNKTKTITSWQMTWLNRPSRNVFLEGVFDKMN